MHEGGPTTYVVKSGGRKHPELFVREKLHKSIVAASLSAGAPTGHAESIARKVTDEVLSWLETRPEVTTADLRRTAAKHLKTYHPDASYLYEHHRTTL
jgi:2-phosphoglycerate kinase